MTKHLLKISPLEKLSLSSTISNFSLTFLNTLLQTSYYSIQITSSLYIFLVVSIGTTKQSPQVFAGFYVFRKI